jgi:flavin reductase (DIM6/NTAB) family NADH-FMN oxidoreductase RutF
MGILPEEFRRTLGHFATGVTVVTVVTPEGSVHGMTASAFTSVSLEPPLVLVCVGLNARTHGLLPQQQRFGINVLREEQEAPARYFATTEQKQDAAERLGVKFRFTASGVALLEDSLAQMECTLVSSHLAGDHTIFVGQVEEARVGEGRPLLFYRGRFCGLGDVNS